MPSLLRDIVATATILALCPGTTDAFNIGGRRFAAPSPATRQTGRGISSPLFTGGDRRRQPFRGEDDAAAVPSHSSLAPLLMAEGDADKSTETDTGNDVEGAIDAVVESSEPSGASAVDGGDENNRSGFVTALLLGPPLILKFVIVLVVKFLTDLVVFPLLFLYRLASRAKRKVLSFFGKGGDGEVVNGDGTDSVSAGDFS